MSKLFPEGINEGTEYFINDVKVTSEEIEELSKKSSIRLHEESPGRYRKLERMTE
jgi:hypothetical protein